MQGHFFVSSQKTSSGVGLQRDYEFGKRHELQKIVVLDVPVAYHCTVPMLVFTGTVPSRVYLFLRHNETEVDRTKLLILGLDKCGKATLLQYRIKTYE